LNLVYMRIEDGTNRFLDVIHGSDPKIDESSFSLAGPTLTGDQGLAIISASPRFQEGSETNWEIIPAGLTLAPDTCGLTSPHVPEYAFDPLPAPGLCPSPLSRFLSEDSSHPLPLSRFLSEDSSHPSPLSRYLSEDSNYERICLGLPLTQDSVSFDCEHCGKKFTRASDLTYVYFSPSPVFY
jgi:hypothetical protein